MGFTKTKPKYSGDGIAIWEGIVSEGKNEGKVYLKVQVLGGNSIFCFEVLDKVEEEGEKKGE
ncbi:hypothetical protein LCGC14_2329140 [marine sediment metagenome]|uniref:Uncharacterized protein n=1 Tax=marine sediment metagenome TaxID=412755 RepID=A0A0F9FAE6_9ZZZZ